MQSLKTAEKRQIDKTTLLGVQQENPLAEAIMAESC